MPGGAQAGGLDEDSERSDLAGNPAAIAGATGTDRRGARHAREVRRLELAVAAGLKVRTTASSVHATEYRL